MFGWMIHPRGSQGISPAGQTSGVSCRLSTCRKSRKSFAES